jgi:hypothetical protein
MLAASILDSCLVVFSRTALSGALRILKVIRDGDVMGEMVVDGLAGARSIALSASNERVYVTGWFDQAVAAFSRQGPASFRFLGRIKEGERLVSTFADTTMDRASVAVPDADYEASWSNGKYPMRLGGNGFATSFSARDSKYFKIGKSTYIAVVSSFVDSSASKDAGVYVYKMMYSSADGSPTLVQVSTVLHHYTPMLSCIHR